MRIAICFDRFGPYHLARLNSAAGNATVLGLEFHAESKEYAWTKVNASEGIERVTLFSGETRPSRQALQEAVGKVLERFHPDAVAIPGWAARESLAVLEWCLTNNCPAILMSETQANDEARVWWKEKIKRRLLRSYSAALVGGSLHAEYLVELQFARDRIFLGYDVIDNAHFANELSQPPQACPVPPNYFLASSRFIPKKNLIRLLSAYQSYKTSAGEDAWQLVLLGDGPLRKKLELLRIELGLQSHVHMPGFQQYPDLPGYYAGARAFVHASTTEQWGLVVNEAMAAGLPLLISDRCGCVPELVKPGENGFLFDPYDVAGLTRGLIAMAQSGNQLELMGKKSQEIVAAWPPARFGEGLAHAAACAAGASVKTLGAIDKGLLQLMIR